MHWVTHQASSHSNTRCFIGAKSVLVQRMNYLCCHQAWPLCLHPRIILYGKLLDTLCCILFTSEDLSLSLDNTFKK